MRITLESNGMECVSFDILLDIFEDKNKVYYNCVDGVYLKIGSVTDLMILNDSDIMKMVDNGQLYCKEINEE